MAETIKIGGELESTATGNIVAAASAIKDKTKNKTQDVINTEVDIALDAQDRRTDTLEKAVGTGGSVDTRIATAKSEIIGDAASEYNTLGKLEDKIQAEATRAQDAEALKANSADVYTKTELNNMITTPEVEYVNVEATDQTTDISDVLPATGAADTIYKIGSWDGSQYNISKYSEYTWNGSSYVYLATRDHGVDNAPTASSNNLVKSGGVYKGLGKLQGVTNYYNGSNYQFDEVITVAGPAYRKTMSVFYKKGSIIKIMLMTTGHVLGGYLNVAIPEIGYQTNCVFGIEYSVECTADISEVRVWIAKEMFSVDGTLSVYISNQGDVYKYVDTTVLNGINAEKAQREEADENIIFEFGSEINHYNGSNYTIDVPIIVSESSFSKKVPVSYKSGETIALKLSSENAVSGAYLYVSIGNFFRQNVVFDTVETIECEEDVKSIGIWVAKEQFTADTTLQVYVSNQGVVDKELDKRTVFTPRTGGRSSIIGKCPKEMTYMTFGTMMAPYADPEHTKKDSYGYRYNWMNFIKDNLPYPTFRLDTPIRDWDNQRIGSLLTLKEIAKAAYDTGFGTENFLFTICPQDYDFVTNSDELTQTFKDKLDELINTFNGITQFTGDSFDTPITFKVKYYELGNELEYFYPEDGEPAHRKYAPNITDNQLYYFWQYCYNRIKELVPDAVILSNAFYYFGNKAYTNQKMLEYLNHQYPNGKSVYDYFDVLSYHYYGYDGRPENIMNGLRNYKQRFGDKNVWITELGCGRSDEAKILRTPILLIIASAFGVERAIMFKLWNYYGSEGTQNSQITDLEYDMNNMTITNVQGEGFYAMKFFADICPQGTERPVISRHGNVLFANWYSYKYGNVYAIWATETGISIKIETSSNIYNDCITLYNYKGETINTLSANNILQVNTDVTYMVGCDSLNVINIF